MSARWRQEAGSPEQTVELKVRGFFVFFYHLAVFTALAAGALRPLPQHAGGGVAAGVGALLQRHTDTHNTTQHVSETCTAPFQEKINPSSKHFRHVHK